MTEHFFIIQEPIGALLSHFTAPIKACSGAFSNVFSDECNGAAREERQKLIDGNGSVEDASPWRHFSMTPYK
jgi:hypothetical protein